MPCFVMVIRKTAFRNSVIIALVGLFGFSSVFNIFSNRNSIQVGNFKLKNSVILSLGGHKSEHQQRAIYLALCLEIFEKEAKDLGLVVTESSIKDFLQNSSKPNGIFAGKDLNKIITDYGFSKEGISLLAKLEILKNQVYSLINLGFKPLPQDVTKFLENVRTEKDAYYFNIDPKTVDVRKYGTPEGDDILEMLINSPDKIGEHECEVVLIGHNPDHYSMEEMRKKFEVQKCKVIDGKIYMPSCTVEVDDLDIDHQTFLSKTYTNQNGKRIRVKFENNFGLDQKEVENLWYSCEASCARACMSVIREIEGELNKNCSDANFNRLKFTKVNGVSLENCFQKQCPTCNGKEKCAPCKVNDCVCEKCFQSNNKYNLNRTTSMMILFGKPNKLQVYKGEYGCIITYVTKSNIPRIDEVDITNSANIIADMVKAVARHIQLISLEVRHSIKI